MSLLHIAHAYSAIIAMCDYCGYPSLDLRTRADINTASLNMADDARCGTSIHGQEAQICLSRMYTFRQVMSLETLCTSLLHIQERRGIPCPSLFTASLGHNNWNAGILVFTIKNHSETSWTGWSRCTHRCWAEAKRLRDRCWGGER